MPRRASEPALVAAGAQSHRPSTPLALEEDGPAAPQVSPTHPSSPKEQESSPCKEPLDEVQWNPNPAAEEELASPPRVEVVGLDALPPQLRNLSAADGSSMVSSMASRPTTSIDGSSPSAARCGELRARRPPLVVDILRGEAIEGISSAGLGRGGSPKYASDAAAVTGSVWAQRLGRGEPVS